MPEHQAAQSHPSLHPRRPVVLDTNAALDALLFHDAGTAAVLRAVETGQVRWVACSRMRDELERTLSYPALARWQPDAATLLARWDALVEVLPHPVSDTLIRCRDGDDQVFLDLALASGAGWLLTKDRDLLTLARRAAKRQLSVLRPADWPVPS